MFVSFAAKRFTFRLGGVEALVGLERRGDAAEHAVDLGGGLAIEGIAELGAEPAVIANAVFHATGKRVRELPITPDKLL